MGGKRRRRKVALSTGGGRPSAAGNAQKSQGSTQKKRKRCSTLSDSAIVGSFILPALGVILPEVRRMKRTRAAECRRGCYDMADDVENLLKETNIEMKFNISTVMDEISTFEMCLLDLFASDRTTLLCLCSWPTCSNYESIMRWLLDSVVQVACPVLLLQMLLGWYIAITYLYYILIINDQSITEMLHHFAGYLMLCPHLFPLSRRIPPMDFHFLGRCLHRRWPSMWTA